MSKWFAGLEDLALPRRVSPNSERRGPTTKSLATVATPATDAEEPQNSAIPGHDKVVASASGPVATPATTLRPVASVASAAKQVATSGQTHKSAENQQIGEPVASVASVATQFTVGPRSPSSAVPAQWVDGIAALTIDSRPGMIPADRWQTLMRTADRFLASPWAARLAQLGWRTVDVFGCDPLAPVERHDHKGLVWFLPGHRLIAATADTATIETPTGARQTYYRRNNRIAPMVLLWDLTPPDGPDNDAAA